MRLKPGYTGTPAQNRPVLPYLFINGGRLGAIEFIHNTSGNIVGTIRNEAGTVVVNAVSFGAWSPTATTWYDMFMSWNYSTGAGAVKFDIDATNLGTATATAAMAASTWSEICLSGGITATNFNAASIDGIHIWNTVEASNAITLDTGSGSLNGASRTSQITAASFDGSLWTSLAANKIKLAETQTQAGVLVTGTYVETPVYLTLQQFLALKDT